LAIWDKLTSVDSDCVVS